MIKNIIIDIGAVGTIWGLSLIDFYMTEKIICTLLITAATIFASLKKKKEN